MAVSASLGVTSLAASQPAERTQRVLIIYETDSLQAAAVEISAGLRRRLVGDAPTGIELYTEYLDSVRFPGPDNLDRVARQLSEKYRSKTLDAVLALGPTALAFLMENRREMAPDVPVFFGAVTEKTASKVGTTPDIRGVVSTFDVRRTMDFARLLQPGARKAVVITGSADFDRSWETTARADLGDRYSGFDIRYLSDLTLDGFERAVGRLPADTIVLMLSVHADSAGQRFVPRDAARKIATASSVPVYSVYDTFIDGGVLGGYMGTFQDTGEQLATLVQNYLRGDRDLSAMTPLIARPVVDWREVERFGIDAGLLPAGTDVRFRAPSLWDDYREQVLVTIAVLLLQAATIAALIVQGNRRKKAEAEVATGQLELAHLSRASLLGELSGAFAHELNQPLTSILANAQAGKQIIESGRSDDGELHEILSDIIQDDQRAAEVISALRRLLTKHELILESVDLNDTAAATLALARGEFVAKQTRVDFKRAPDDVPVVANGSQLQQVVLNLIVNAMDATSHLAPSSRQIDVTVRKQGSMGEISVTDNGHGLTPDSRERVFKPFVSTKTNGLGLGLAICRTIASAHGGTLAFDPEYDAGARIVLSLPLRGMAS